MNRLIRAIVGLLALGGALVIESQVAEAWPYGCSADYNYGGNVGVSECDGGTGSHRSRLTCRNLVTGVVSYSYGPWRPPGYAYYNQSWAYCSNLPGGYPAYAYDAIGVIYQTRSW